MKGVASSRRAGVFEGVIFDVDGTLVDSNDAHAHAFIQAFRDFGHEIAFERVRRLIGKGADKLIPEGFGPLAAWRSSSDT